MSGTPIMPLWVGDFLADTLDLSAKEVGAYMLILMTMWKHGGRISADSKKLKRVARAGRDWPAVWDAISKHFKTDGDGNIFNQRLLDEHTNVARKVEANKKNGARGGRAKALKSKDASVANATVSLCQSYSYPYPMYSPSYEGVSFHAEIAGISGPEKAPDPKSKSPPESDAHDLSEAVAQYNDAAAASGWPKVQLLSEARKTALRARLRDAGGIEGWKAALDRARASPHLCGRNDRGWTASFDFLCKQSSFTKLMEGNYDDRKPTEPEREARHARGGGHADSLIAGFARHASRLDRGSE